MFELKKPLRLVSCITSALLVAAVSGCSSTSDSAETAKDLQPSVKVFKAPRVLPYTVNVEAPMAQVGESLTKGNVRRLANMVADWQIRHQEAHHNSPLANFQGLKRYSFGGWLMGTMAVGMAEWGQVPGNDKYLSFIKQESERFNWQVEERVYDADDYMIGQTYLELYDLDPKAAYLEPLKQRLDYLYKNWPTVNKEAEETCHQMTSSCRERWTWIDALFMGGPVWAHMAKSTGDNKYLEFGDFEYWASFDTFWDEQESLLYRDSRFIDALDKDHSKIFWSRGNGWVVGSLVRMLEVLPEDHASRDKYLSRFKSMTKRLAEIQLADGSWHPSLLNPEIHNMPENSGSSFFTYAMAWGINQGLLDSETYLPVVEKAWGNLARNIYADGRMAYIQPSGYDPRPVYKESTDVYGVGAFLLAASEVIRLPELAK